MTQDNKTKEVKTDVPAKDISNAGLWITSIWKFCRSLALTIAGGTLIYLICKWLIGK